MANNRKANKYRLLIQMISATALICLGPLIQTASAKAAKLTESPSFLPVGSKLTAPMAFLEMCARSPEDCRQLESTPLSTIVSEARTAIVAKYDLAFSHARSTEPSPGALRASPAKTQSGRDDTTSEEELASTDYYRLTLDKQTLSTLKFVNTRVNRSLIADTDADIYHVKDYWEAPILSRGARGDCEDFALTKRRLLVDAGIPAAALSLAIVRTRFDEDHAVLVVSTADGDYVLDNLTSHIRPWRQTGYQWVSRQGPSGDLSWVSIGNTAAPDLHMADKR